MSIQRGNTTDLNYNRRQETAPQALQVQDSFGVARVNPHSDMKNLLSSIAKFSEKVGVQQLKEQADADYISGQGLRAAGQELTGKERPPSRKGHKAMDGKLRAQALFLSEKQAIEAGERDSDSPEYSAQLGEIYKGALTGDPEIDTTMHAAFGEFAGQLGTFQSASNRKRKTATAVTQVTAGVTGYLADITKSQDSGDEEGVLAATTGMMESLDLVAMLPESVRTQTAFDLSMLGLDNDDDTILNTLRASGVNFTVKQERDILAGTVAAKKRANAALSIETQNSFSDFESKTGTATSLDEWDELAQEQQENHPSYKSNDYYINQRNATMKALKERGTSTVLQSLIVSGDISKAKNDNKPKDIQIAMDAALQNTLTAGGDAEQNAADATEIISKNGITVDSVKTRLNAGFNTSVNAEGVLDPKFQSVFEEWDRLYEANPSLAGKHLSSENLKTALLVRAGRYAGQDVHTTIASIERNRANRPELTREQRDQFKVDVADAVDSLVDKPGLFTGEYTNNAELRTRVESLANLGMAQGMQDPEAAVEWAEHQVASTHEGLGDALIFTNGKPISELMGVAARDVDRVMDYTYDWAGETYDKDRDQMKLLGGTTGVLMLGLLGDFGEIERVLPIKMEDAGFNFNEEVAKPELEADNLAVYRSVAAARDRNLLVDEAVEFLGLTPAQAEAGSSNWFNKRVLSSRVSSAKADARKAQIVESYGGATDQIEADAIVSTHDAANGTTTPSTVISQEDPQIAADEGSETNAAGDHIAYYATTSEQTQGLVTGGIGHLMTEEESALYPEGTVIPDDVVQDWYDVDLQEAVDDAGTFIGNSDVPEEVTSIITNMSFNMGLTRLLKFKGLQTAIRSGDWELAADEMEWVNPTTKTKHTDWYNQVGDRAPRLIERMRNVTD